LLGPSAPKLALIECGWHANEHIEQAYREAIAGAMPGVQHLHVDGRDAAGRGQAWAAADIFCSLSDNIQETFGLTPVEAMAAGLPSVISDWNGYKDTVRHGVDGLRVPTWMPAPGDGTEFARNQALGSINYDHYCGHTGATVVVDVAATAQAFAALAASPGLRAQLGDSARQRARAVFDWSVVYRQYEALWEEQAQRRAHAAAQMQAPAASAPPHPYPARMEPYTAFASYPSRVLTPAVDVKPVHAASNEAQAALQRLAALKMVQPFVGGDAGLVQAQHVLAAVYAGAHTVAAVVAQVQGQSPRASAAAVHRRIAWLAKLGLLTLSSTATDSNAPQA
jgi:alpha-maltose-1-phosphate synthase